MTDEAQIQSLAQELPYARGVATKKLKRKEKMDVSGVEYFISQCNEEIILPPPDIYYSPFPHK